MSMRSPSSGFSRWWWTWRSRSTATWRPHSSAELRITYAESFALAADIGLVTRELGAALAPSAGTRNVLVHGYLEIDYAQVAAAIPLALRDYSEYVRQAARWMRDHAERAE